jgi:hypothetical protein
MDTYNETQLISLKSIDPDGVESIQSMTAKQIEDNITNLTERANRLERVLAQSNAQLRSILDLMTENDWYGDDITTGDILDALEEILDHRPTKTITITANLNVFITADVPLKEIEDFDADTFVSESISIDMYSGDANLDDWNVDTVDWE